MTDRARTQDGGIDGSWGRRAHLTSGYLGAGGIRIMAVEEDTVHLLIWDRALHYLRSDDAGRSWGEKTLLTEVSGAQAHPSIHRSGPKLHVIWQDGRGGTGEPYSWRIYHKRSDDRGRTWGPDVLISSAEAKSFRLSSAVNGATIHAAWSDKRHNTIPDAFSTDGNWEIYYMRSTDGGESWGPDVRLTSMENMACQRPAICASGDTVLLAFTAWEECGRGILDAAFADIYLIRSADAGQTWGPVVRLTDTPYQSMHPQAVAIEPGIFGVLWEGGRSYDFASGEWNGPVRLLFRRSTDFGQTWSEEQKISDGEDATHSLAFRLGPHVHVTWTDRIEGRSAACYAFSPDGGSTWDPPTCLTTEGEWWAGPPGATADRAIVTMHPTGQTEVYYCTRPIARQA